MTTLSLRARLTVWYSLALLIVLCLFATTMVWQQGRIGLRRIDRELDDMTETLANILRDELMEMPSPHLAAVEARQTMAARGRELAILDEAGKVEAMTWSDADPLNGRPEGTDGPQSWTVTTAAGPWRVHAEPRTFGPGTFTLVVAAPLVEAERERREAIEAMWVGIPVALGLAAIGGLWLASVGLRPITTMAQRAAEMTPAGAEDLGESSRHDELGQFARAFNDLLGRLRRTLQTQRQFMADASHELRTPVSVIQSAADVTLSRDRRDEAEYRDALGIAAAQSRRLGRLVEDMLVLARADAGGYPLRRVSLYLDEVIVECSRTLETVAAERGVTVRISPPGEIAYCGDEELLRRMIVNLVQNAVAHTAAGGTVAVETVRADSTIVIRVVDHGPGIPVGDRERIFDRFVQLDPARRSGGAGLGLPIARWIAEAHGGTLDLEGTGSSGSTFRVILPAG